ncbi:hypothetical protein Ctha_1061 [Chloroherpeton thalassium ATCC 35110]|uniref:CcmD family protein n=1 Tax=Chloroherpeton thalassium (strain ATCC 35110 / GB-78) TaxID=517418 RepID=B3QXZ7_CHLT3|nr:CcmD family protein [Chloroherpeton thalassium]ACF13525.1 hypothetical protein Ctha_1061 [Chloroherpeton thalassium ATCC 35110]
MIEFLEQNPLYIVLTVVMIIWTGIFSYLFRLDLRLSKMEKQFSELDATSRKVK